MAGFASGLSKGLTLSMLQDSGTDAALWPFGFSARAGSSHLRPILLLTSACQLVLMEGIFNH